MTILKGATLAVTLLASLISFILMGVDKRRAKKNKWRVSEKTLFLAAACFGALGGTLGMFYFHHKTKHWYFRLGFPALLLAQGVLVMWILAR